MYKLLDAQKILGKDVNLNLFFTTNVDWQNLSCYCKDSKLQGKHFLQIV